MAKAAKGKGRPAKAQPKPKQKGKAKPKAEPRYDTPEAMAKFDRETFEQLLARKQQLDADRNAYLTAKERAADLKKMYEAARIEYEDAIDERKKWRGQKPPGVQLTFADVKPEPGEATGPAEPTILTPKDVTDAPGWYPEDLWKKYPLTRFVELGLTQRDVEILHEGELKGGGGERHPLVHYGDIGVFTKAKGSGFAHKMTDIKGFGDAAFNRFEDAQNKFWAAWPGELGERFAKEMGYFPDKPLKEGGKKPAKQKAKAKKAKPKAKPKPKPKPEAVPDAQVDQPDGSAEAEINAEIGAAEAADLRGEIEAAGTAA